MKNRHAFHRNPLTAFILFIFILLLVVALNGCTAITPDILDSANSGAAYRKVYTPKYSQPPSFIDTPYSEVIQCFGTDGETGTTGNNYLNNFRYSISVGQFTDLTNKLNINISSGGPVSNGLQNMLTAAFMASNGYRVVNRAATAISDLERELSTKQLIKEYDQNDAERLRSVTAGEITGSDYFVYGSVTSFNYNLASGGSEVSLAGIQAGSRYFVANVGIDIFLVETRSTEILKSISLQKQLVGREVKTGIFRFDLIPDEFFSINSGIKEQEMAAMGLRMMAQKSVVELTGFLYGWSNVPDRCKTLYASANLKRELLP